MRPVRILREELGKPRVLLSDAYAVYLKDRLPRFAGDAQRAVGHVYSIVGDFPLNTYRREHANAVVMGS